MVDDAKDEMIGSGAIALARSIQASAPVGGREAGKAIAGEPSHRLGAGVVPARPGVDGAFAYGCAPMGVQAVEGIRGVAYAAASLLLAMQAQHRLHHPGRLGATA
jgi:hypothetical protein